MDRFLLISRDTFRRISTKARLPISLALGVVTGAVVGGLIDGLDYLAFIADLHHRHEIDAFAFRYLDFLLNRVIEGAGIGAVCGLIGTLGVVSAVLGALTGTGVRKIVLWTAGGAVIVGVVACIGFVALAAIGIAVHGPVGPQGFISPGDFLISLCSFAAGLVAGVARTDD
ncbi:hypothetical protein AB0C69_21385 [Actinomadura sp. NPDC048032]|uniref:hypothetical protein n=1 Tax=Actinomadura sp. NPDC048032 TaxID=3155747 RepID=UPI0033C3EAC1